MNYWLTIMSLRKSAFAFLKLGLFLATFLALSTARAEQHLLRLRTDLGLSQSATESQTAKRHLDTVICILDKMQIPYEILQSPARRNRSLTASNDVDGFFLHSAGEISEEIAVATHPVAIERWFFYQLKSENDLAQTEKKPVGTVLGTNEHNWLRNNGHRHIIAAPTDSSVVKMLHRKRVAEVLMDENLFWQTIAETQLSPALFKANFVRYAPLVLYFSKHFTNKNPLIVASFNAHIDDCVTDLMSPSEIETNTLIQLKEQIFRSSIDPNHLAKLVSQNLPLFRSENDNRLLDAKWTQAVKFRKSIAEIDHILENSLSVYLKQVTASSNQQINEIFVTSPDGFIVGMNRATSDYIQSDEAPYENIMINKKDWHISKIDFDASTESFQIQLSVPVIGNEGDAILGILTIGFDADNALSTKSN